MSLNDGDPAINERTFEARHPMTSLTSISSFLAQRSFAVVGVSRTGKKFGNSIYMMLKERGCRVFPVNPFTDIVDGDRCYPRLRDLPEKVGGVVVVVPPKQTESIVKEAADAGIQRIWMQQGSESRKAIQYCEQYGIDAVYGQCLFMFAEPVGSFHKFHKWARKLMGRLPG
ncbi:MAG TPA: CoA-binding protein [Bacteroidota bacterium]